MNLKVRLFGDPCLRKKATVVKEVGPSERMLIQAMLKTMYESKGIGLAAPQVGIGQRIFVVDVGEGPRVFINPRIIRKSGSAVMEEGCLSIPDVSVKVKRPEKVRVKYLDADGLEHDENFEELLARVIQHENDHLNGKLITDFASRGEMKDLKEKLDQLKTISKND